MTHNELLWLVKSSGRILGPFPTTRIAELLRTREISVLDEISPPLRRWQTLQYHDEFREVVDSLRKASLSERTEATWTPGTGGLTQTLTDLDAGGDLTEELTSELEGFTNTQKEIVVHNVREQTTINAPQTLGGRFQPAHGQNTAIRRQVEKTTRGLWLLTAVILIAAAAFILHKKFSSGTFELRPTLTTLKSGVINQIQIGHYADALRDMKNYFSDPLQAGELSIYYGSLLIHVEGQTVIGRRLLTNVLNTHRADAKQAYTGLGVADLLDGEPDSARDNFDHALSLDPEYLPAIVNQAAVNLQKADYSGAKNMARLALTSNPLQSEALITLAEAQLYLFKSNSNLRELAQVSEELHNYRERAHQWDYAAEIGFYALYFDFLRHDHQLEEKVQAYLDFDPRLTTDHRHNVFIYRGRTQWKILARFCEQMTEQMGEGPRVSALLASCYAHEGRWDDSRRAIEKAVHQAQNDPLIEAWYGYILRECGDSAQAGVELGRATALNRHGEYVLPSLLQARTSQQAGLVDSARENWQKINDRDLNVLPAVAGLAWVNMQNKSTGEAARLLKYGLKISPDYIPLLEIRQKGETEGWYNGN